MAGGRSKTPDLEDDTAPRYSIRVTSRLTSIELDTLRVWERRYGFPKPARTAGGSRVYSAADVEALKLIRRALEQGYRPNEVVGKPPAELAELALVKSEPTIVRDASGPSRIANVLSVLRRNDLPTLRAELREAALALGPRGFVVELVQPICVRVGELWAEGKFEVAHEHMLSECLSAQLRVLAAAYEDRPGTPRVLLSTLPNERHGLGLEMIEVYLGVSQITPIPLGIDTPREQIVKAAFSHAVDAIGLLVTRGSDLAATADDVVWMMHELPRRVGIWLGGSAAGELGLTHEAVTIVSSWTALDDAIARLKRSAVQKAERG